MTVHVLSLSPTTFRLRYRRAGAKDVYRFVRGTRAEADQAAAAWGATLAASGPAPAAPTITLAAWLDQLLTLSPHLQPRTLAHYRDLVRHLTPLARRPIGRLTTADGLALQAQLLDQGVGARTAGASFRLARWALGEATRLRILPYNPFAAVRMVRGREPAVPTPDAATLTRLAGATDRTGLLLRLAAATGARRGEILALTWSAVDLAAGALTISGALEQLGTAAPTLKTPKTRSGRRTVGIPASLIAELKLARLAAAETALAAGRPLASLPLIPAADRISFYSPNAATKAAKRALAKLGSNASLHGLRHAHATQLLAARISPRAVATRLGHSNVTTTLKIYAHALPTDDAAATAAIGAILAGDP